MNSPRFCVRIEYRPNAATPQGHAAPPVAYLSHRDRTEWSRRQAQRHAADVRRGWAAGRASVQVVPA